MKNRLTRRDQRQMLNYTEARWRHERSMESTSAGRRSVELRHQAHPLSDAGRQLEAHALFVEAAALFEREDDSPAAAAAWYDLAESHYRLALRETQGSRGTPLEHLSQAEEFHRRVVASPGRRKCPHRYPLSLDALGRVLRHRVAEGADPELLVEAADLLVRAVEDDDQTAARWALGRVSEDDLSLDRRTLLGDLYRQAGELVRAEVVLRDAVDRAMRGRSEAYVGRDAHTWAVRAQTAGKALARVAQEQGDAVQAFLAVENVSGLSYFDHVKRFTHQPADKRARARWLAMRHQQILAAMLAEVAATVALIPEEALDGYAAAFSESDASPPVGPGRAVAEPRLYWEVTREVADAVQEAVESSVPRDHLIALAEAAARRAARLHQVVSAEQPSCPWEWGMTADQLGQVVAEAGGPMLRLHLVPEGLLAIVAWWDGALQARAEVLAPDSLWPAWSQLDEALADIDLDELDGALASMDLSSILRDVPGERMHVLPGRFVALLPIAALGPPGSTLLDRFPGIVQLPNLLPLWWRQGAVPPRRGVVTVVPVEVPGHPETRYHQQMLAAGGEDELQLVGPDATLAAVDEAVLSADVVAFYTHGDVDELNQPGLLLRDARLIGRDTRWLGVERVELWACRSGVDTHAELLAPVAVDDTFGLDVGFHHVGVRSTIGTTWTVPDVVTGCLAGAFRRRLAAGREAPEALADAQRWWKDVVAPRFRATCAARGVAAAWAELLGRPDEGGLHQLLGPTAAPSAEQAEQALTRLLESPRSWAGFRLLGACERRPTEPWTPEHEEEPTAEDLAEATALGDGPEATGDGNVDVIELRQQLSVRAAADQELAPLERARAYELRWAGSRRTNMLVALSWIEAALARAPDSPQRPELAARAAALWLDLMRRDCADRVWARFTLPRPVAQWRARSLLRGLEDRGGPLALAVAGWVGPDLDDADLARLLDSLESTDLSGEDGARAARLVAELALALPELSIGVRARLLALQLHLGTGASDEPPWFEIAAVAALTLLEPGASVDYRHLALLDERSLGLAVTHAGMLTPDVPRITIAARGRTADIALTNSEAQSWGWPLEDWAHFWRSTGTPGLSYRAASSVHLTGRASSADDGARTGQLIGALQLQCDLRVGALARIVRVDDPRLRELHRLAMLREEFAEALESAAMSSGPPFDGRPLRLDPFRLSVEEILEGASDIEDVPAWEVAMVANGVPKGDELTVAARLAKGVGDIDALLEDRWSAMYRARDSASRDKPGWWCPTLNINHLQAQLDRLPEGHALLAAGIGYDGSLVAALAAQDGQRIERTAVGEPGSGLALRALVPHLLSGQDPQAAAAALTDLVRTWETLLGPLLHGLGRVRLSVLAPGPLRWIPWLGLRADGKPLAARFRTIRQVSSWSPPMDPTRPTGGATCLWGGTPDLAAGRTVIEGLRTGTPLSQIIEPAQPRSRHIVEAERLEELAPGLQHLRVYGTRPTIALAAPGAAGVSLTGDRALLTRNLPHAFPRCDVVELWAEQAGLAELDLALSGDRDRLPGLVQTFVSGGARTVIDLAWPVHDVPKALLCERTALVARGLPHDEALLEAWLQVAAELRELAESGAEEAAVWEPLDIHRQRAWQRLAGQGAPTSLAELGIGAPAVETITDPVHLAAARCWGP